MSSDKENKPNRYRSTEDNTSGQNGKSDANHVDYRVPNSTKNILENDNRLDTLLHIIQYHPQDSHDLLDYTLHEAIHLTQSRIGFIGILDEDNQQFLLDSWSEEVMNSCKIAEKQKLFYLPNTGIWGEAVRLRKPVVVNDYSAPHPAKKGHPPGHVKITRFIASPIFSGEKITGVIGVGNKENPYDDFDVNQLTIIMDSAWKLLERQHAYQLLQESDERFRQLAGSINEAFWLRDISTGVFLYFSQKYEEIWQRPCQDLINNPDTYLQDIHPDDREKARYNQKKFEEDRSPYHQDLRIIRPDGSVRWINERTYPVCDQNNQVIRSVCIAEDITQRKETESALFESNQRLKLLFETMQEGFSLHEIICDQSGKPVDYRFLDVNPAFERITGLKKEDIIGKTVLQALPNTESYWIEQFGEVALTGKPIHFVNYSGEFDKYYEVNVYSPKSRWFAVISTDITSQKKAEMEHVRLISELEQKNAELEQFTYTVSHDLKSPLITIKGFLGLLEKDLSSGNLAQVSNDIQRINNAADKMRNLLDDLLELSRIGRIANPPTFFPFGEAVNAAVELLSGRITENNIQIKIASDFPKVYGDRQRIIEVVQNYLENAIKFMGEQTKPLIEIGWNPGNGENHFFVKDNGIGINPRYHNKVFGLFEKLNAHVEGTGVGLALVKRIVEFHGGRVWLESNGLGQGSTFYFSLPNSAGKEL